MKKSLFSMCLAIFALSQSYKAQSTQTIFPVTDTLHYYFNKHYFKTGTQKDAFPFYKSAAATSTALTHVGSKFEYKINPAIDSPLVVTGLEAFACMGGSTSQLSIKVHLYLCNLDANNMPILPAVDSVITTVSGSSSKYSNIGGNFKDKLGNPVERRITKDYAVLFRNMSTVKGDTVKLMRTASKTYTAWPGVTWQEKYSDGFGFARNKGTFVSTTNLNLPLYDFYWATDYEFCVAPRVKYYAVADHLQPNEVATSQTITTFQQLTYKNTSSFHFAHRQYNLLEFYKKWSLLSPFVGQPVNGGWSADSSITWFFSYADRGPTRPDPRVFLPYGGGNNQIISYTDSADCFVGCEFRASLRTMQIYGRGDKFNANQGFTVCVEYGPNDALGMSNNGQLLSLNAFPNPMVNGQLTISGLNGKNTIQVSDILGQVILNEATEQEKLQIDLNKQSKGTYFVRVTNVSGESKVLKIQKLD